MDSKIEDFFDKESSSYKVNVLKGSVGNEYLSDVEVNFFLRILPKLRKKNISLDIGVGNGRFSKILANHFNKVISMDISTEMIKQTKKYMNKKEIEKVKFIHGNFESYKFPKDDLYDLITSFRVFKYFNNVNMAISKHSRLLSSKGISIIQYPNSRSYQSIIYLFRNLPILGKKNNNYLNSLALVSLKDTLIVYEQNGMNIKSILYGSIIPYFIVARVNNNFFIKLISVIDRIVQKSFLKYFCRDFVILAEKK